MAMLPTGVTITTFRPEKGRQSSRGGLRHNASLGRAAMSRPRALAGVLLVVLLASCGNAPVPRAAAPDSNACTSANVVEPLNKITASFTKWNDAIAIADVTPKIALAPQVARLQELRREVTDVAAGPSCVVNPQRQLVRYMDAHIAVYLAFMNESGAEAQWRQVSGGHPAATQRLYQQAQDELASFNRVLQASKAEVIPSR